MSQQSMILFIGSPIPAQKFLEARLRGAGHQLVREVAAENGVRLAHYMIPDIILFHGNGAAGEDAGLLLRLRRPMRMRNTKVILLVSRPTRDYIREVALENDLDVVTEIANTALLERKISSHNGRPPLENANAIDVRRSGGVTRITLDRGWRRQMTDGRGQIFNSVIREGLKREEVIVDASGLPLFDDEDCAYFDGLMRALPSPRYYVIAGKNFGRLLERGDLEPDALFISREELMMALERDRAVRSALAAAP